MHVDCFGPTLHGASACCSHSLQCLVTSRARRPSGGWLGGCGGGCIGVSASSSTRGGGPSSKSVPPCSIRALSLSAGCGAPPSSRGSEFPVSAIPALSMHRYGAPLLHVLVRHLMQDTCLQREQTNAVRPLACIAVQRRHGSGSLRQLRRRRSHSPLSAVSGSGPGCAASPTLQPAYPPGAPGQTLVIVHWEGGNSNMALRVRGHWRSKPPGLPQSHPLRK